MDNPTPKSPAVRSRGGLLTPMYVVLLVGAVTTSAIAQKVVSVSVGDIVQLYPHDEPPAVGELLFVTSDSVGFKENCRGCRPRSVARATLDSVMASMAETDRQPHAKVGFLVGAVVSGAVMFHALHSSSNEQLDALFKPLEILLVGVASIGGGVVGAIIGILTAPAVWVRAELP